MIPLLIPLLVSQIDLGPFWTNVSSVPCAQVKATYRADCCGDESGSTSIDSNWIVDLLPSVADGATSLVDTLFDDLLALEQCMPNTSAVFTSQGLASVAASKAAYDAQPNDLLKLLYVTGPALDQLEPLTDAATVATLLGGIAGQLEEVKGCMHLLAAFDPVFLKTLPPVVDTWLLERVLRPILEVVVETPVRSLLTLFVRPIDAFVAECPAIAADFQTVTGPALTVDAVTTGTWSETLHAIVTSLEIVNHDDKLQLLMDTLATADAAQLSTCIAHLIRTYKTEIKSVVGMLL